ncbi:MAG: HAMP domain-containing sensor histidine kinase, partial [Lachnospiraceae bacterium]|nr:HAMP domain-containing sensor histidine kinase [Lachnospiraceae bacterium]
VKDSSGESITGMICIIASCQDVYDMCSYMEDQKDRLTILMITVMFALSIGISILMTRKFKVLRQSVQYVAEGHTDEQIKEIGYTEVREIAGRFNEILGKMQILEDSRQEFVSNVSHELKTPITSIKVLAESLLTQPDADASLYREFMSDIVEEIDRENEIITDLLALVKMDKKVANMNVETVNINELIEGIIKRLKPLAQKREIEIGFEPFRPVVAEIDSVKLSLAITNLIENGIKYNEDHGWVHVYLNADHRFFYVKVEDNGVGIPEEYQDQIFERFYRVDKARSRETGGTGLGLAITRDVALLHKGAIKVHSTPGEGTTFTMRIPLTYTS